MGCVGVGEAELWVDKAQSLLVHPSQVPWQPTKAQLSGVHWVFLGLWGQSIGKLCLWVWDVEVGCSRRTSLGMSESEDS